MTSAVHPGGSPHLSRAAGLPSGSRKPSWPSGPRPSLRERRARRAPGVSLGAVSARGWNGGGGGGQIRGVGAETPLAQREKEENAQVEVQERAGWRWCPRAGASRKETSGGREKGEIKKRAGGVGKTHVVERGGIHFVEQSNSARSLLGKQTCLEKFTRI